MNEHNINEVDGLAGGHDAMGSVQRAVKRLFDVAFSLVGMILLGILKKSHAGKAQ